MTRADQMRNFFASGGSGSDKELALAFNTEPYIIRGYVSSMNKKNPGLIDKRPVAGQRKQEYYQVPHKRVKPVTKSAPILSISINGTLYRAIPVR
jgi:hypothetical protein